MADINSITITGRLSRDVEVRYTQKGDPWASMNVAVNNWNSKTKEEETTWVNVLAFGKQVEFLADAVGKGGKIVANGMLKVGKFTSKDGTEKLSVDIIAHNVQAIPRATNRGNGGGGGRPSHENDMADEEIPF